MLIYKAINKITHKVYIGLTEETLDQRIKRHFYQAGDMSRQYYFVQSLRKHGIDGFTWEVIDEAKNLEELNKLEIFWIAYHRSDNREFGYNSTKGGDGMAANPETARKISETHRQKFKNGYIHPNKGKKFKEGAYKIRWRPIICIETGKVYPSMSHAARELHPDYDKKPINGICSISSVLRGVTHTAFGLHWKFVDENLNDLSKKEIKTRKKIKCIELNRIFDSIRAAERELKLGQGGIGRVFSGKQETYNSYHWEYVKDEPNV